MLPRDVYAGFDAGQQAHVPLLAGWNADEFALASCSGSRSRPLRASRRARKHLGEQADAILKAYPAGTDAEALESPAALASDILIGWATWKWIEVLADGRGTSIAFVERKVPVAPDTKVDGVAATSRDISARHAGEIKYMFGTFDSIKNVTSDAGDRRLSDAIMTYWSNFAGPAIRMVPPCRSGRATTATAAASCTSTNRFTSRPIHCGPLRGARRLRPEAAWGVATKRSSLGSGLRAQGSGKILEYSFEGLA